MSIQNAQRTTVKTLRLKRAMNVPTLVMFGLAYMVPLTIFSTYGLVGDMTGGRLPLAYVITTLAMAFTAISYASIVKKIPTAGSAYGYSRKAFGTGVGFITGWGLMVDYLLLPMVNYMFFSLYFHEQFPAVPAWLVTVIAISLVTTLNVIGIKVVKNANVLLVAFQLIFVVLFIVFACANFSPDASAGAPFSFAGGIGPVVAGASILALSFLGFDAVFTLAEEAKEPTKSVPRAILLTVIIGGLMFLVVAWVGYMAFPDFGAFKSLDTAPLELMGHLGGAGLKAFFLAAYMIGCLASALSAQTSTSRVLFSMGRDRLLPSGFFGKLNARFRTPVNAILVIAVVSLLAIWLDINVVVEVVSFGALAAFSMVNLAVIKFFLIDEKRRGLAAIVKYAVLPVIGFGLTVWLWFSLSGLALSVGLIWVALGLIYLAVISKGFRKMPKGDIDDPGTVSIPQVAKD
ncbi:MAG: APC family permease [Galactobacter sp.]